MMEFKKVKPIIVGSALSTLLLTGCGKVVDNTKQASVVPENNTEAQTEQNTTESNTEEVISNEVKYYNLAADTYNTYTEFYARSKMAYKDENAKDSINIQRIENIIKVINGEVADLTPDEVINAKEAINYVLLSQELVTDLDNIIARDLGYITINGKMKICDAPKLSIYARDEETRAFVEKYENLRDKVQSDINSTGSVSEETKNELIDAVIQMEKDYLTDDNQMNDDVVAEGNKLLENIAKKSLVELTALAINKARIMTDEFPGGLKLIAETDEEREIESKTKIHGLEILTDREKDIHAKDTMERIETKYLQGEHGHTANLVNQAKSNTNTYSKKDEYEKIKEQLIICEEINAALKDKNIELVYTM